MKKVVVTMMVVVFAVISAVAQNTYTAQPGNGSLLGKEIAKKNESSLPSENWGLGIRLGLAQNDPEGLKEIFEEATDYDRELTKNAGVFGLEILHERFLGDDNMFGFKVGLEGYGQNKLTLTNRPYYADVKFTENTYAIPVTLYFKRNGGIQNWSFWAGAGVTFLRAELEAKISGYGTETLSKNKVFPHVTVGAEYRLTEVFALGLDVKYNIAAKVRDEGDVISDRSGIGGALTGRFYF